MLLTLDIGNSAAKGGLFDGDRIHRVFHVDVSVRDASSAVATERWVQALKPHLETDAGKRVERVGITTVVPDVLPAAQTALRNLTGRPITVLHPNMSLPFTLGYDTPQTLGMDRLAAAAAAWVRWGRPYARSVIAVDAGTAITYEVVDASGVYRGGAIGAGPALVQRALRTGTAQLPTVPLTFPATPVGQSTQSALQSGILWGTVDAVRGMLRRLHSVLSDDPYVVLTGGWSEALREHVSIDTVQPHLVLDGVRVLLEQGTNRQLTSAGGSVQ